MGNLKISEWFTKWLRLFCFFSNPVKVTSLTGLIFCLLLCPSGVLFGQATPLVAYSIDVDPIQGSSCSAYGTLQVNRVNGNQWICPSQTSTWILVGGSAGGGTVSAGSAGQFGYYQTPGTTIVGHTLVAGDIPALNYQTPLTFPIPISQGGTGTSSPVQLGYSATNFDFPAITPGTSISGGTLATVTIPKSPLGVGGTNTKYPIWLSAGTGSPEAVIISGGTCTSGQGTSCTLQFTPSNTHSGSWTITSATCGIAEAEYYAPGNTIYAPLPCTPKWSVPLNRFTHLAGVGGGTKISAISSSSRILDVNVPGPHPSGIQGQSDGIIVSDLILDAAAFDGVNGVFGLQSLLPGGNADTQPASMVGLQLENVQCNNVLNCLYMERVTNVYSDNMHLYGNSKILFTDQTAGLDPFGGRFNNNLFFSHLQTDPWCYNNDCTAAPAAFTGAQFRCINCEILNIDGARFDGSRTFVGTGVGAIEIDGGEGATLNNVLMELCDVCLKIAPQTANGHTQWPDSENLTNLSITQPYSYGIEIVDGTSNGGGSCCQPNAISITGGQFTDSRNESSLTTFVYTGAYSLGVNVSGNTFLSGFNLGPNPHTNWVGITVGANSSNVIANGNTFTNEGSGNNSLAVAVSAGATNIQYDHNTYYAMSAAANDPGLQITAAATITLPGGRPNGVYSIGGATPIQTINSCDFQNTLNALLTLVFPTGNGHVVNGSNLSLHGNFDTAQAGSLSLTCNSVTATWFETARNQN